MTLPAMVLLLQAALAPAGAASGAIAGRVSGAPDDAPLAGATVRIDALDMESGTAADGRFTLAPVPAGRWELRVTAARRPPRTLVVLVPEGDTARIDVRLDAPVDTLLLRGRVVDVVSGEGVPAADVSHGGGATVSTDRLGEFVLRAGSLPAEEAVTLHVRAFGYAPRDTTVGLPRGGGRVRIPLVPRPVDLTPLTVRARGESASIDVERALFDREPRPGVLGMAGEDLRQLPFLVERDVLRSLQALPGVVHTNDLSVRLHVRGGAPDQNLFLLDDAPLLAPYHLFGIFGVLDPGTVERIEFYRGSLPARYGGALSSVLEVQQRTDFEGDRPDVDIGLGLLSARVIASGGAAGGRIGWMLAGRRSVSDLALKGMGLVDRSAPFMFWDGQARVEWTVSPSDVVRASAYGSDDDFTMFLRGGSADLFSSWSNRVGSLRWDHDFAGPWEVNAVGRYSGYRSLLRMGGDTDSPTTTDDVAVAAVGAEVRRRGTDTGVRMGVEVEATSAEVDGGAREGGYVDGRAEASRVLTSAWAELERWVGPVRLAPGARVSVDPGTGGRAFAAPRLSARVELGRETFLTAALGRTHQLLSTLRDDRYPLPGAPIWFLRADEDPVTTADQATVSLDGWYGDWWNAEVSAWGRRFRDVPAWRPEGSRDPSAVSFDDGRAWGGEVMVRRHGGSVHGWAGYGVSWTTLDDEEDGRYFPSWDRRHSLNLAAFWEPSGRATLMTRVSYGTGTAFWPQAGEGRALWLDRRTGDLGEREFFPIWSDDQLRFPQYFRLDVGGRWSFHWGDAEVELHGSVINLTGRPNVLFYEPVELSSSPDGPGTPRLVPSEQLPFTVLPSVGIDVRF